MGTKAETYTLNQVKGLLLNLFNSTVDRLDKKLDILKEKNSKSRKNWQIWRKCVQYNSDNVEEVNKKLEDIDRRVEEIKLDEITEDFGFCNKSKAESSWLRRPQSSKQSSCCWVSRRNQWSMGRKWKHHNGFYIRKVRDWRRHLNWKSTSHGKDTEKGWHKK